MRDGDGDGKCQEEDGKWVPCPPGVPDGSLIDRLGRSIGKIPLGTTIGDKPNKPTKTPAEWGPPEGPRVEKPKPRALRRLKPKPKAKPEAADKPKRSGKKRSPLILRGFSNDQLYLVDQPVSEYRFQWLADGLARRNPESIGFPADFMNMEHAERSDMINKFVRDNYDKYLEEFAARKESRDPFLKESLPYKVLSLNQLRLMADDTRWSEDRFFGVLDFNQEEWWDENNYFFKRYAEEVIDYNDYPSIDEARRAISEMTLALSYYTHQEYMDEFKRKQSALYETPDDKPLTPQQWYKTIYGKDLNRTLTPTAQNAYDEYIEKFETKQRRKLEEAELEKYLDEDGNLQPELVDQYITAVREKADKKAQKILDNAKNQLGTRNKTAANEFDLYDWTKSEEDFYEDAEQIWLEDNPEPEREDYENDEDYNSDYDDWENRKETEINEIANNEINGRDAKWASAATAMFNHEFTGLDGKTYTTRIVHTRYNAYDNSLSFRGEIYNENGTKIGFFDRDINTDNLSVYHSHLKVDKDYRDAGLASTINALNEQIYNRIGIETITVQGVSSPGGKDGYKGATHWPKNGFTWADDEEKNDFLRIIQRAIDEAPYEAFRDPIERRILQELHDAAKNDYNTTITPADLLNWPGAEEWFQEVAASINYRRDL